jgi:hypothetical protein
VGGFELASIDLELGSVVRCSGHSNELLGTEVRKFSKILGVTSKF